MATIIGSRSQLFWKNIPGGLPAIIDAGHFSGNVFFVDSNQTSTGADSAGYGYHPDAPFLTIDYAVGKCTANQGDVIFVLPGHAETINAASAIDLDVAGISVIGLGNGEDRPTITIGSTSDAATVEIGAADVLLKNVVLQPGNDGVDVLLDITADGAIVEDCELRADVANAYQADTYIAVTGAGANAADRTTIRRCKIVSIAAGAAQAINIGAVQDALVIEDCWIDGDFSAAGILSGSIFTNALIRRNVVSNRAAGVHAVELTGAATGLFVDNRMYSSTLGTILDPGSLKCLGNLETDAIDQAGVDSPRTSAGGFPDDSITAAAIANGAIDAATFAAGAIDAAAIANAAIDAATFAAGAITAAAIATDAIDADALAADAVAELADGIADEAVSGHVTAGTVGAMLQPLHSGAAQAGAAGTVTLAATASATSDLYIGAVIQIIGGTGAGQSRAITAYDGATKIATISPNWTTNPAAASVYVIHPLGPVTITALGAGSVTAAAIATDAIDADALAADALAEIADAVADEAVAGHATAATVGAMLQPLHSGAAQAGGAAAITLAATASATNDLYNGCVIQVISGTGVGQARLITDYDGGTKIATVAPAWTTQPILADVYVIHPCGSARIDAITAGMITAAAVATDAIDADALAADALAEIADAVADEAGAGHVTAATLGAMLQTPHSAAAQAGAAGTVTLAATASATNDLYNGCVIQIVSGTAVGQARLITDYDGGTKIATVVPNWATNPVAADVYVIHPYGSVRVDAFTAGTITAAAIATDAIDDDALAADAVTAIATGVAAQATIAAMLSASSFIAEKATAAVPQTAAGTLFTVTGGKILIEEIIGEVTVQIGNVANLAHLQVNPEGAGATTDISGTVDIDSANVGYTFSITGTFANAMIISANIPVGKQATEIVCPPGTIELYCAANDGGGGRVKWAMRYRKIDSAAAVA